MIIEPITKNERKLRDVQEFEALLKDSDSIAYNEFGFDNQNDIIIVRAPARLDLMGGIADYCGANVFEATLSNAVVMGSQSRQDEQLQIFSIGIESEGLTPSLRISLKDFYKGDDLKTYEEINQFFKSDVKTSWAGYILGAFYVLLKERKSPLPHFRKGGIKGGFEHGLNMVMQSDVPMGAGISSSAAIEIAAMVSINEQYQLNLAPLEIARLAQIVENRVVGAPCGIMDQITSVAGEEGKVVSILCQPDKILELVELPENTHLVGINSRVKRSTAGSAYTDTRTAAFMGLTILTKEFHLEELSGYLCRLPVQDFRQKQWDALPKEINGGEFLDRYGETIDPITTVDPKKTYRVRSRVEHPIYEHARVQKFIECMKSAHNAIDPKKAMSYLIKAGKLMYASHWSYRQRVGLGSSNTDIIVNKIRELGENPPACGRTEGGRFLGAKITGGGGGGTVAALCVGDISNALEQVISHYKAKTGIDAEIFTGSSPGAAAFGKLKYRYVG
ncbi:MAG: galactokinase [Candidatus Poribacteria bacterium]